MVAEPMEIPERVPQAEGEVTQRAWALLDPAVRALDADVRHWLSRVQGELRDAGAAPARASAIESAHGPVAM